MAQINLLKQNSSRQPFAESFYRLLPAVFGLILLGVFCYYGWLIFSEHSISGQTSALQIKMNQESQGALNNPRRSELLARQLQLKDLNSLVAAHLYWSQIFPVLAQVTLKKAIYDNLTINPQTNTIVLSTEVPTLEDLDKYMQVFNLPQFNKYFSNVRIGGFDQVQGPAGSSVKFIVTMNYDPSLVQYKPLGGN
ncbi:MAG: hypothetical protein P4L74_05315 [Candidatus Doudnabacteria bacterium]|nr:hypothetical protein [Candidatus Doudnabacteria bacterium]